MNRRVFPVLIALSGLYFYGCAAAPIQRPDQTNYSVATAVFTMVTVPVTTFPKGTGDLKTATIAQAYGIADTETTYELWRTVYDWATDAGRGEVTYRFQNPGRQGADNKFGFYPVGTDQHPVTTVSWRDCVVWLNALTECYNARAGTKLTPVYYADKDFTLPLRDAADTEFADRINETPGGFDKPFVKQDADGFRLPTEYEWELAARFIGDFNNDGDICDPGEYYPYLHTSGSKDTFRNEEAAGETAWFPVNSGMSTHPVKTRAANGLGLYDMSGNVWEWIFDHHPDPAFAGNRIHKGGAFSTLAHKTFLTYLTSVKPYFEAGVIGFRFVESITR